jgi:hypothetical protein
MNRLYTQQIHPLSKSCVYFKYFVNAALNFVFSFLRLMRLRGSLLKIVIPAFMVITATIRDTLRRYLEGTAESRKLNFRTIGFINVSAFLTTMALLVYMA